MVCPVGTDAQPSRPHGVDAQPRTPALAHVKVSWPGDRADPVVDDDLREPGGVREWLKHATPVAVGDAHVADDQASIVQVQAWMGHADVQTTMKYVHHGSRAGDAPLLSAAFRPTKKLARMSRETESHDMLSPAGRTAAEADADWAARRESLPCWTKNS